MLFHCRPNAFAELSLDLLTRSCQYAPRRVVQVVQLLLYYNKTIRTTNLGCEIVPVDSRFLSVICSSSSKMSHM